MNVNGNPAAVPQKADTTLITAINKQIKEIEKALPKHLTAERLARIAITAIRKTPRLGTCTKDSFMGSVMLAAQLGLEVNTPLGQAYLIPYKQECTFQVGYQGIIELAYRTDRYKRIEAVEVYADDDFEYCHGTEQKLLHTPKPHRDEERPVAFYALYELVNGGMSFKVMTYDEVMIHAIKYSKSYDKNTRSFNPSSPWATSFASMAKKTVLVALLKYAPKSPELQQAVAADNCGVMMSADDNIITLDTDFIREEENNEAN